MYSASIYFFRIPWTTEMGHSLFSFNAIAIKLWENLQLHVLFSNNIIEFNLSGEKKNIRNIRAFKSGFHLH